jgi:hypothetical protein
MSIHTYTAHCCCNVPCWHIAGSAWSSMPVAAAYDECPDRCKATGPALCQHNRCWNCVCTVCVLATHFPSHDVCYVASRIAVRLSRMGRSGSCKSSVW